MTMSAARRSGARWCRESPSRWRSWRWPPPRSFPAPYSSAPRCRTDSAAFQSSGRRADQQVHPVRCRCVDHLPHGRSDAGIHLIAVLHFLSLHRPVLRQRVVGIGKQQVVLLLFLRELLRQLFVLRLLLGLFASLFLVGRLLLGLLLVRRLLLRRLLGGLWLSAPAPLPAGPGRLPAADPMSAKPQPG